MQDKTTEIFWNALGPKAAVGMFFGIGSTSLISRLLGEGSHERAKTLPLSVSEPGLVSAISLQIPSTSGIYFQQTHCCLSKIL